jgi:hypothetical protein
MLLMIARMTGSALFKCVTALRTSFYIYHNSMAAPAWLAQEWYLAVPDRRNVALDYLALPAGSWNPIRTRDGSSGVINSFIASINS